MTEDKLALRASHAGIRFIAQTTIYNSGDFERLHRFVAESYHPDQLAEWALEGRVAAFQALYRSLGRLRVKQVVGTSKYHVVVLVQAEKDGDYYVNEFKVEEDYPHRITAYSHRSLD